MSYFLVGDEFCSDPKVSVLLEQNLGLAAIGLWTLCGSWCRQRRSPGVVPEAVARRFATILQASTRTSADFERTDSDASASVQKPSADAPSPVEVIHTLCDAGLWDEIEGGYQFHDWEDVYRKDDKDAERKRKDADRKRLSRQKERERKASRRRAKDVRGQSVDVRCDTGDGDGTWSGDLVGGYQSAVRGGGDVLDATDRQLRAVATVRR